MYILIASYFNWLIIRNFDRKKKPLYNNRRKRSLREPTRRYFTNFTRSLRIPVSSFRTIIIVWHALIATRLNRLSIPTQTRSSRRRDDATGRRGEDDSNKISVERRPRPVLRPAQGPCGETDDETTTSTCSKSH